MVNEYVQPIFKTYTSYGETRIIKQSKTPSSLWGNPNVKTAPIESETYWNIKYNTDGDNCFTYKEQVEALEKHYNLSLTSGTRNLLLELGILDMFDNIELGLDSVNDKSLKSKYDKMTKEFEAKMHAVYTKIVDMGLLEHNKVKK